MWGARRLNCFGSTELKIVKIVNLRTITAEERRRQTLCDKRDNNYVWKSIPPNVTFYKQTFL